MNPYRNLLTSCSAVLALGGLLLLSGCSAPEEPESGQQAESADPESGEAESSDGEVNGSPRLIAAAQAGLERASSFGFTEAGFVSAEVAESYRDLLEGNSLAGEDPDVEVTPASCADPLAAVDFSPLLLGQDTVRADFFAESFSGAGSVELAELADEQDAEQVQVHRDNVRQLLETCADTEFTLDGIDYALSITEPETESSPEQTISYSWKRTGEGTTFAQILFTQVKDDIIMVSFTGGEEAASAEFTSIAEAISAETAAALEETP
ncbi:hypothetical protein [Nesterenkonia sp. Act20]|uniref:hypothetical protein n=1 Tax=Nesterenkonia sp. Act20 TaxID=1483432 RepID=UPI001C491402|nr:hypothetical protein [Nesterenkonia sp. Act20]